MLMSNTCLNCQAEIKKQNKFCSRSCSAKYNNSLRPPRSIESRKKVSESIRAKNLSTPKLLGSNNPSFKHGRYIKTNKECANCQTIMFTTTKVCCSKECLSKYMSEKMSAYLKIPTNRKKYKGRSQPSYMEISFKNWLEKNGMHEGLKGYLAEIQFYNPNTKKYGWADFVFPRKRLIVELDGSQHRKTVEQDQIRDQYLKSRGWEIIRITHYEYRRKAKLDLLKSKLGLI